MLSNAQPKPRPSALDRKDKRAEIKADDLAENRKVKVRSKGRCEIQERTTWRHQAIHFLRTNSDAGRQIRCDQRAVHIHHKIGGWRRRGRADSALAENKLHVCAKCHADIHAHVLVPLADGTFRRVT